MTTCIPLAQGVPAAGGPPRWWDGAGSAPLFNQRVDDPRWRGAATITYPDAAGSATGEHGVFRALHHVEPSGQRVLYLSWWMKTNPAVDAGFDRVVVGFQRPGLDDVAIETVVYGAGAMPSAGFTLGDPASVRAIRAPGWGLITVPRWARGSMPAASAGFTRVWTRSAPLQWVVAMRVPLLDAGDLTDDGIFVGAPGAAFGLWYVMQSAPLPGVVQFQWPRTAAPFATTPPAGTWERFELRTDPGCGSGIRLAPLDVATTNVPAHEIRFRRSPGPKPVNTFHARPENRGSATVPAGGLQARFRIANWGSQPDWNQVADPAALWELVPADAATANPCPNVAAIPVGAYGDCTFTWTLTDAQITPFDTPPANPPRRRHQCLLVALEGPGLQFINDSVYRNMDVVAASRFEREAEVSVAGLGALAGPTRRVYLYLETTNMPERADPRGQEDKPRPSFERELERLIGAGRDDELDSAGPIDHVAERLPTYRVHVYHETGDEVEQDGRRRAVLRPQTSFGYVVRHDGPLFGWEPELTGPNLVRIAPRLYELTVPVDGVATVTTTITAHERPPRCRWPRDWKGCLPYALGLLVGLAMLVVRRIRRR